MGISDRLALLALLGCCTTGYALSLGGVPIHACAVHPRCSVLRAEGVVDESEPADAPLPAGPLCDYPGCDKGRVMGGLGAMELFKWWPIKAYRPCPKCAEKGLKYARSGQSLDEVMCLHARRTTLPAIL